MVSPFTRTSVLEYRLDSVRVKGDVCIIDHSAFAVLEGRIKSSQEETDEKAEAEFLFRSERRVVARTPEVHLGVLRLAQGFGSGEEILCELPNAVRTHRLPGLPELKREIRQRSDDRDPADEVPEVSERIENGTAPAA